MPQWTPEEEEARKLLVMPQTDNAGTGGVGRLPKRYEHVAIFAELTYEFPPDAQFNRAGIDDETIAALMLLMAEA